MKLTGDITFHELPSKRRDTATGNYLVRTWVGGQPLLAAFLASDLPAGWVEREVTDASPHCTVVATYAVDPDEDQTSPTSPDPILRTWSLIGNDSQYSLWRHPKVLAALSGKDLADLVEIRSLMNQVVQGGAGVSFEDDDLNALAERLAKGDDDFLVSEYVLRKTEVVYASSVLQASHSNVNCLYTKAQLAAAETTLPVAILIDWTNLSDLYWQKRTPTVEMGSNGRYQLTQEYYGIPEDEIDTWKYDLVT